MNVLLFRGTSIFRLLAMVATSLFFSPAVHACEDFPQGPAQPDPNRSIYFAGDIDPRFNPYLLDLAAEFAEKVYVGPVTITSGFRSCARNKAIKGSAKKSAHLMGNAIDLRAPAKAQRAYALKAYELGINPDGQIMWNSCRPHLHISYRDAKGLKPWDECGGKGKFGRKQKKKRK